MISCDIESSSVWTFQLLGQTVGFLDVIVIIVSIYLLLVLTLGIFRQKSTTTKSQRLTGRPLPGPWNFPIVGYLPKLGLRPFVTMWNLSRRYGCIYQIRMGNHAVVVVSGLETLKEAFVKQGKVFSGRPDFSSFKELSRGKSFTFQSYSREWKVHSRMAARALSSFVRNTSRPIDQLISGNATRMTEQLVATRGEAIDAYGFVEDAVLRVIYSLCFGDVVTDEFCDAVKRELFQMRESMPKVMAADVLPWLGPFLRPQLREFQRTLRRYERLVDDMTQRSAETGVTGDSTCIVHSLIKAADEDLEVESESPLSSASLDKDKILTTIHDLIGAGSEGVVNFIYWAIRYMIAYPDTQERLREEVTSVITCDISPVYKHRCLMPYVECFIWEVVRHSSMSPLTLPHSTLEDTVLCDYFIPKGTLVCGNLYSVNQCTDTWKDPEKFRPERFFDESGKAFDRTRLETLPCFGLGNRKCIGEMLGRTEMFLFLVVLMQNCRFGRSTDKESDCSIETMDGEMSLAYRSKPYKVVINGIENR